MERYLGLDTHRESCTFSVVSQAGKQVQRQVVETNGRALVSFVRHLPGTLHLCLEEGEWSQWLYEILSPHVAEMVVVWPERRGPVKSDALDARHLAERLRAPASSAGWSTSPLGATCGCGSWRGSTDC